jgi:hypothetical protein
MKKILFIIFIGLLFGGNVYAKCISGDCINGQGTKTDADGNKYVGEFKDGKRNGQGTFDSQYGEKYVGEWKDGDEHGQGISTWKDGTEYVGEFKNSFWNGQGTLTLPDKSKHVGEFKDLSKNGQGTTTYPDGTKLVGVWKKNKPNGQVTYVFPDGGKWVGEIVDGDYFNVQGTNIFFDKKNYTGEYKDDKRNGQGTYMFSSKTKYVGEWKNGNPNGQGAFTFPNGDKYVGEWKDGKYNDQGTYIFTDGTKYVVKWKDGKRHGVATKILPSGAKYIVEFKDGKVQPKKKHTLNTSELYDWIKNQTQHITANGIFHDDRYKDLLENEIPKKNIYLGMSKKTKDPLIDSFLKVLGGPPNEIIYLNDKNYIIVSACRSQSCDEKGFVFINTEEKFIIGLIRHFFIDDEKTKSFDEGDFLIFSKTHKSFDEIPKIFIQSVKNWIANSTTSPNKVRFIGADNSIKEVENLFK